MREANQLANGAPEQGPTVRDLASIYFRHVKLFKISFLLAFAAGMAYAIISPGYEAHMKVLVRRGRIDPAITPTQTPAALVQQDVVSEEELNSQADLFHNEDILKQVVEDIGLAYPGLWARISRQSEDERVARAVKQLANRLEITPARKSQLISVSYRSSDGRLSAAVLQSLQRAYLAKQVEIRRPNGQQAFFDEQMKGARTALESSQRAMFGFLDAHGIASAPLQRDLVLQRLSEAEAVSNVVQSSLAESTARVRALDVQLQQLPRHRVSQSRSTDNPQLQEKLKSKLLELELKRTELLTKFQPSYRLVAEVDEQIAQARTAIQDQEAKPLRDETTEEDPDYAWANSERLKTVVEIQALQRKQDILRAQVSEYRKVSQGLAENVVEQDDLQRKLKAAEDNYLLYSTKREEARIGDALDHSGILNVTIAEQPSVPAFPASSLWTTSCLSLLAACVFGSGAVFAADYIDPTIRTPHDATKLLGFPVLLTLPATAIQRSEENA